MIFVNPIHLECGFFLLIECIMDFFIGLIVDNHHWFHFELIIFGACIYSFKSALSLNGIHY